MQKEKSIVVKEKSHSRISLSGIYNACRCEKKGNTLLNRCVEDPRYQPSGMTSHFITARGFTLIKRVGQALPDNAPAKGHIESPNLKNRYFAPTMLVPPCFKFEMISHRMWTRNMPP